MHIFSTIWNVSQTQPNTFEVFSYRNSLYDTKKKKKKKIRTMSLLKCWATGPKASMLAYFTLRFGSEPRVTRAGKMRVDATFASTKGIY